MVPGVKSEQQELRLRPDKKMLNLLYADSDIFIAYSAIREQVLF